MSTVIQASRETLQKIQRESSHFERAGVDGNFPTEEFHRKVVNMLSSRAASPILKSLMTWPRCDSHSPRCAKALICVWSFDPEQSKQQERCRGGGI